MAAKLPGSVYARVLGFGLAYWLAVAISIKLVFAVDHIALFWPANAIAAAALIFSRRRHWPLYLAAMALAFFAARLPGPFPLPVYLGFCAANFVEVLIVALLVKRPDVSRIDRERARVLPIAMGASILASAVSALIGGGIIVSAVDNANFWMSSADWLASDLSGLLLVLPLLLVWLPPQAISMSSFSRREILERAAVAVFFVTACIALPFYLEQKIDISLAFPYLLFPALIWIAMRFGIRSTTLAVLLSGLSAITLTYLGKGPFIVPGLSAFSEVLLMEMGLVTIALTATGMAVVVAGRRHAEEALRESEGRFAKTFYSSPVAKVISGIDDGRLYDVNDVWLSMLGYARDEVIGRTVEDLDHWADPAQRQAFIEQIKHDGRVENFEAAILTKNREVRMIALGGQIIEIAGQPRLLTAFLDITERKKAEEALKESEERFTKAFLSSPAAMSISKIADGLAVDVNDEWLSLFDYSRQEAVGLTARELGCWADLAQRSVFIERLRKEGQVHNFEATLRTRNGDTRYALLAGETIDIGGENHLLMIFHDITERKQAEEALRLSEKHRRDILRTAMEGFWVVDMEGHLIEVNEAYCRMSGYSEAELLTMHISDLDEDDSKADVDARIRKIVASGEVRFESRHCRRDGSRFDVAVSVQYSPEDGGRMITFLHDITDRKRGEEQTRREATRLKGLVNILQYRAKTVDILLNNALNEAIALTESRIGYIFLYDEDRQQFAMNTWSKEVMEQCAVVDQPMIYDLAETGLWGEVVRQRKPIIINDFVADLPHAKGYPEGHVAITRFMTAPVFKEGRIVAIVGVANKASSYDETDALQLTLLMDSVWKSVDIKLGEEENAKLSSQLQHAQKMEVVGQLAGGTAHDFNNLLQVISINLELIDPRIGGDKQAMKCLESAKGAVLRGAKLSHQLLAFSRRQTLNPQIVDPNVLVAGAVDLLRRTLGEHIELETRLADGILPISVDPVGLENAILNLAINARAAMPKGGRLMIHSTDRRVDDGIITEDGLLPAGDYTEIAVSDTGCGMPPEVLAHAFEPFFTTKEVGQGSGLGLSMVYGFTLQSDGHATIESEVGRGTTVRMIFPAADTRPEAERPPEAREAREAGAGTVLVVEDDPEVRESVLMLLQNLGYDTREAANGVDALRILDRDADIDLLFTDVVMPGGITGLELAREAVRHRHLKVLLTSGYPEKALEGSHAAGDFPILGKPYTNDELSKKLRAILAE